MYDISGVSASEVEHKVKEDFLHLVSSTGQSEGRFR
jgi:hypothetical protein